MEEQKASVDLAGTQKDFNVKFQKMMSKNITIFKSFKI